MKLTTYLRDAVVENALVKAGVRKAEADYKADRVAWATRVADESIGGADAVAQIESANKKVAKIVATLPEHLREDVQLGPKVGNILATFGGRRIIVTEWVGYRPAKNVNLAADHPLSVEFFTLEDRKTELDKRRDSIRVDVRAVVNSVTTVARLLAIWPEAKELLPTSAAPKPQLPAIKVEHLNAAIGLPTDAVE